VARRIYLFTNTNGDDDDDVATVRLEFDPKFNSSKLVAGVSDEDDDAVIINTCRRCVVNTYVVFYRERAREERP